MKYRFCSMHANECLSQCGKCLTVTMSVLSTTADRLAAADTLAMSGWVDTLAMSGWVDALAMWGWADASLLTRGPDKAADLLITEAMSVSG